MPTFINERSQNIARLSVPTQIPLGRMMTEINRKLSSGIDGNKILDFVFDSLDLIIPYDRIGIAIVEGEGDEATIRLKWVRSKIPVTHLNLSFSAPVKGSSLQTILDTNQPRVINDLIKYAADHPNSLSTKLVLQDGIRSNLTCPLRSENRQIGVVFFSSALPDTYANEHVKTFLEISDELSMIVEHGRLKNNSAGFSQQKKTMSMILHDLKSPLSTIQGFAELAVEEPWFDKLDPEGKEVFQIFLRNSRYMFRLLNSLSEFGELDKKNDLVVLEDVDLPRFCKEMGNFGKVLAEVKEIELSLIGDSSLPAFAKFDRHKIQRILDNLFSNAVKYSKRGSQIVFTVQVVEDRLQFSVQDQGLGIPEAELPLLFHEFGKTSVRPTENETSTGLGLAIAKRMVEQHGGEISVSSTPGTGSTFSFWVPFFN